MQNKKFLFPKNFLAVIMALVFSASWVLMSAAQSLAVTTTPQIVNYQGVLKDAGGTPITTAQSFRFSLWNDADYDTPADFDGAGAIPPAAPGFSGYEEVQTITPDANGFFQLQIGSVTALPDFNIAAHLFLQVEVKPSASADTAYEELDIDGTANTNDRQPIGSLPYANNADFLDNAEIGTGPGDIVVLDLSSVFPQSVIPGGSNQNTFILDSDDTGGDITLQFGTTLNESMTWDSTNFEFDLSDDLNITGGIQTSGNANFSGTSEFHLRESSDPTNLAACTTVNELIVNTALNRIEICTATGIAGAATWIVPDAGTIDGLDSTQFLRSDTSTNYTSGTFTFNAGTILLNNGTTTLNGVTTIGDGGDFVSIDSSSWDISPAGVISGLTGLTSTGAIDFSGSTQFRIRESNFSPAPDCGNVGELVFDTTAGLVKYCTVTGSPGTWSSIASQDLDSVYDNDVDKSLAVDNASGLTFTSSTAGNILFNLANTGDLTIQDNGTTFALFSDTGLFEISGVENTERLRLTDTTNADSVGMYVGTGTPDGVISAQSGSTYYDELGAAYVNTSVGGSGSSWSQLSIDKAQTVTVAKSGGNFTSIKTAVESITDASTTKRYVVLVYPGTYAEDPITIPDFVSVVGEGTFANVIVTANVTTSSLIIGGAQSVVRNIQLQGASGVGGVCFRTSKTSFIQDIEINDCETGLMATSSTGVLVINNLIVRTGVFTDVVRIEAGATGNLSGLRLTSTSPISKVYHVTGTGSRAQINNAVVRLSSVVDAVYVNDGGLVTVLNSNFQDMVNGIHVGPTGASTVRGSGGIVENTSGYTFYVESGAAKVYYDGFQTQKEKFNVHPGALFTLLFNNNTAGEEGTNVFGRFSVGSPEHPESTFLGEGDSFTNGMLVYTFDGAIYTDVSDDAANPVGTPVSFPGNTTGNAIYISANRQSDGDFIKFGGLHYMTTSTVANMGAGDIVHEYWNGSAWTPYNTNCISGEEFYVYEGHCFERPDSSEHDNFEMEIEENWVANDPVSLGTNYYWIRLRIASDVITAPVFEQFEIHTDAVKVNSNGSLEFQGNARFHRPLIDGLGTFIGSGSNAPSNTAFSVGASPFTQDFRRASFRGDGLSLDELTSTFTIPQGIDTSSRLDPIVYWKKANDDPGDVQWKLDMALAGVENVHIADGSNIATAPRAIGEDIGTSTVQAVVTDPDGDDDTSDQVIAEGFTTNLDISAYYPGDQVFLRLYRDAADPDDTYDGNAIIVGFRINGTFWKLGASHEDFD